MKHYPVRSNAESGFFMIKQKFGDYVNSKNELSQTNEILAKILVHNICCLIQEMYENNITINFEKCNKVYIDQKVPEEFITRDAGKAKISDDNDFSVNEN